jgi:predicted dehydrogenase
MDRRLKVGMVGVGGFGCHRRERMRETGLFDLVATYDLSEEAMAQAGTEDGAAATGSYEALLATPGLEAMVISSGARFHCEQALAALDRGLHVFIEKPLASTMEEVRAILAAQQRTGLVVGCGHRDHSAEPFSSSVKRMIDEGELGKVVTFEATTAHSGGFHIGPDAWRGSREHNPGGMLFQCGVHKLHELIYYFGPVRRIRAAMRYDLHETETADVALCQVEFVSGLTGTLNAYHITPSLQSMMITGTRAALFKDERPWEGEGGKWIQRVPENLDGSVEARVPFVPEGENDPCGNLRSFYRAVTQGGTPYPSAVDGARALAPVFAAAQAAESGTWVDVEEF